MLDGLGRLGLAVLAAGVLGGVLLHVRVLPRDVALTVYAVAVAVLGIFAILGPGPAVIGGGILVVVFLVGAAIYGVIALVAHWADR